MAQRSIVDVDREHRERERREEERYAKSGSRRRETSRQDDSTSSEEDVDHTRRHEERIHHHAGSKSHRELSSRRHERDPPRGHKSSGSLKPHHSHHPHHPHHSHPHSPSSPGDRSSFSGRDSWKNYLPDSYEGVQAMDHSALESTLLAFMNEERDKTLIRLRDHGYNPLTGLVVRGRGYEYEDGP